MIGGGHPSEIIPHIKAGRFKALAVALPQRDPTHNRHCHSNFQRPRRTPARGDAEDAVTPWICCRDCADGVA